MKKRIILYHHFDGRNIIDEYVIYFLQQFRDYGCDLVFHSNSELPDTELQKIEPLVIRSKLRENRGFDFASWKEMVFDSGKDALAEYDEVIFANSTFYGPLYPPEEIFGKMEESDCDFWAPTKHSAAYGIPEHVQPYFLVCRKNVVASDAFWAFWASIKPDYPDLWTLIWEGEIRLSYELVSAGFKYGVYADMGDYREMREIGHYEPFVLHAAPYLIESKRLPFVKTKAFYNYQARPFTNSQFIFRALDWTESPYPRHLITDHIGKTAALSWSKNMAGTLLVSDRSGAADDYSSALKLGVFAHLFYLDNLDIFFKYLKNIPVPFDLNITTPSEELKEEIENQFDSYGLENTELEVRIVENRGRDAAPWILEFKDKHLKYDLAAKLHVKLHSQQSPVFSHTWNRYLFDSMMANPGHVADIIDAFESDPQLGMVFPTYPPLYNMIYPHGYSGSPEDQHYRQVCFDKLGITPPEENAQPLFSAGGMSWYRPRALEKLIDGPITIEDFPPEPLPTSSTFAHGFERAIPYIAQSAGYSFKLALTQTQLEDFFQMYEDRVLSHYKRPDEIAAAAAQAETPAATVYTSVQRHTKRMVRRLKMMAGA